MPFYVNEYVVFQNFGGPEEGGWWFSSGEFQKEHATFTDLEQAINYAAKLRDEERANREGNYHDRYSVLGGGDVEFYVDDEPGSDFPTEHPHYE